MGEAEVIKKKEATLRMEQKMFGEKLHGFLKENGLPDDFSLPELCMLAVRKCRELIRP